MPVQRRDAVCDERRGDARVEVVGERLDACLARGLDSGIGDLLALEEVRPACLDRAQAAGRSPEQTRFIRLIPLSPISA